MDFVYRLLTPSLTKGGLNDHETFNNILAFFQSNAGGTVQEVFPEEFRISQLPTNFYYHLNRKIRCYNIWTSFHINWNSDQFFLSHVGRIRPLIEDGYKRQQSKTSFMENDAFGLSCHVFCGGAKDSDNQSYNGIC